MNFKGIFPHFPKVSVQITKHFRMYYTSSPNLRSALYKQSPPCSAQWWLSPPSLADLGPQVCRECKALR